MKKLFFLIMALSVFNINYAQKIHNNEVPQAVKIQFNKQFPKATDVEWKKVDNTYKVDFETFKDVDHDVWYSADGKMLKHKEEISKRDVPKAIKNYIKKNHFGYRIDEADKITEGKNVTYKVEIENYLDEEILLYFKEDGTIIKQH